MKKGQTCEVKNGLTINEKCLKMATNEVNDMEMNKNRTK